VPAWVSCFGLRFALYSDCSVRIARSAGSSNVRCGRIFPCCWQALIWRLGRLSIGQSLCPAVLISPLWIAPFTEPSAWMSCSYRPSRGVCCTLIAVVRWPTVPDPRMLGVVASSHSRGWFWVRGLTRLAAAQSVDRLAGWQAARSPCRAVWPRDESIDRHGDQLAIQSSCMLQNATVERMFQISQMSDLKQSLSLCARNRVAIIGKCRCWKYIARPSNARPRRSCCCAVSSSVCGRSPCAGGLARDESCCPRVSEAACSSSQLLVRSGVGVVAGRDCLLAWHRQHPVAIASCRCSSRGLVANGHRGGVAVGGCLEDLLVTRSAAFNQTRSANLCAAVVDDESCVRPSQCPLAWWIVVACRSGRGLRRSPPSKGHSSKSATRLYTENGSAVPRSSCFTAIFTPVQHHQNTLTLLLRSRNAKDRYIDIAACILHLVVEKVSNSASLVRFAPVSYSEVQGIAFGSTARMHDILFAFFLKACAFYRQI
jgi:hypothetical protein